MRHKHSATSSGVAREVWEYDKVNIIINVRHRTSKGYQPTIRTMCSFLAYMWHGYQLPTMD